MCACGSYGGGDVHEGGGGRRTQEVSPVPHQQNEVLEGQTQGTGSDLGIYVFFQGHSHLVSSPDSQGETVW